MSRKTPTIIRYQEDRTLGSYDVVWFSSRGRPVATIRAKCEPVACDIATKVQLFDVEEAVKTLAQIPRRNTRPRRRVAA